MNWTIPAPSSAPDCTVPSRRDFLKTTLATATAATLGGRFRSSGAQRRRSRNRRRSSPRSTNPLPRSNGRPSASAGTIRCGRTSIPNPRHIVRIRRSRQVSSMPTRQQMVREIFLGLHSPEYAEKVVKQVADDSGQAGFGDSSVALFGEPGGGKFEFVLTGRISLHARAAMGIRRKAWRLAGRCFCMACRGGLQRSAGSSGECLLVSERGARMSGSRCSMGSSERWRCAITDGWSRARRRCVEGEDGGGCRIPPTGAVGGSAAAWCAGDGRFVPRRPRKEDGDEAPGKYVEGGAA